jgi:hypothetical protein
VHDPVARLGEGLMEKITIKVRPRGSNIFILDRVSGHVVDVAVLTILPGQKAKLSVRADERFAVTDSRHGLGVVSAVDAALLDRLAKLAAEPGGLREEVRAVVDAAISLPSVDELNAKALASLSAMTSSLKQHFGTRR